METQLTRFQPTGTNDGNTDFTNYSQARPSHNMFCVPGGPVVRFLSEERDTRAIEPRSLSLSHTSDLRITSVVATMPVSWCYSIRSRTGWVGVRLSG